MQKITPCLWFDNEAENAANFYIGVFPNSRITHLTHYGEAGREVHGKPVGSVMTVKFELDGQPFTALNGGPAFKFNEAVSFQVGCETQGEIDYFWEKLREGGDENAQQCGWLKDKYRVSWQIFPAFLPQLFTDSESEHYRRVMTAMLKMKKLIIDELKQAYLG